MSKWKNNGYWTARLLFVVWGSIALVAILSFTMIGIVVSNRIEATKTNRGRGDAPRPSKFAIDGRPADTITEMPDGWPNIASKCVYKNVRAFATTNGDHLALWPDPSCRFVATGPQ